MHCSLPESDQRNGELFNWMSHGLQKWCTSMAGLVEGWYLQYWCIGGGAGKIGVLAESLAGFVQHCGGNIGMYMQ